MAKISNEDRHQYFEKIQQYRNAVNAILGREKNVLTVIQKDPAGAAFKRLALVDDMLNLASNYIVISGVSQSMLKVKSEDALNDGRKSL